MERHTGLGITRRRLRAAFVMAMGASVALQIGLAGRTLAQVPCDQGQVCVIPTPEPPPPPDPPPDPPPAPAPVPEGGQITVIEPSPSGGPAGGHIEVITPSHGSSDGWDGGNGGDWEPSRTGPLRTRGDGTCSLEGAIAPHDARSTAVLEGYLAEIARLGPDPSRVMLQIAGPFPVAGPAQWSDDWHALRCVPTPHLHQGIDIFAERGTSVVAIVDGWISQRTVGAVSGLSVEITDAGGVQYFYAHLEAFGPGVTQGRTVAAGDVLGYVGDSGNARGSSPHLHLEVQPGGIPVPPDPYLDRWLETTERRARRLYGSLLDHPTDEVSFRLSRSFDLGEAGGSGSGVAPLLLLVGVQPSFEVAVSQVDAMAREIEWSDAPSQDSP